MIPSLVIIVCSIILCVRFQRIRRHESSLSIQPDPSPSREMAAQLFRILILINSYFVFTTLNLSLHILFYNSKRIQMETDSILDNIELFAYSKSSLYFLVYFIVAQSFRSTFLNLFNKKRPLNRPEAETLNPTANYQIDLPPLLIQNHRVTASQINQINNNAQWIDGDTICFCFDQHL